MTDGLAGVHDGVAAGRGLSWRDLCRGGVAPDLAAIAGGGEGRLIAWLPILIGCGIGAWFAWPQEPGALTYGLVALAGLMALTLALAARRGGGTNVALIAQAAVLVAAGFLLAGQRAHQMAAPVLGFHYYGPIEGRLIEVDRSARDRLRLTLDQVMLRDVAPGRTPARVRVALMGEGPIPPPGTRVMLTGHLSPPPGPAEPGGYDFRR